MFYTGIGSRETPKDFIDLIYKISCFLEEKRYILRSGGANGADYAFEKYIDKENKEIYLPWSGFNNNSSLFTKPSNEAFKIAEKFHPNWINLANGVKSLHARNCHQVLGYDLKTPSDFVICWTKDGLGNGGTGQAIRIAKHYNIEVFDLGIYDSVNIASSELYQNIKKYIKS